MTILYFHISRPALSC